MIGIAALVKAPTGSPTSSTSGRARSGGTGCGSSREHFRFIRYDERGCGMTEWNVDDLSPERQLADLEAVIAAGRISDEPFTLLGISQGGATCVRYASRHPERVSRLILYGGYAQGWAQRGEADVAHEFDSIAS